CFFIHVCGHRHSSLTCLFSGVRIGRNVGAFSGKAVSSAMGVSLEAPFLVNRHFRYFFRKTPGIAPVFAVFSRVQPDGHCAFQHPLVSDTGADNYSLCFHCFHKLLFLSAHFRVRTQGLSTLGLSRDTRMASALPNANRELPRRLSFIEPATLCSH